MGEIVGSKNFSFSCIYKWENLINGKIYIGQTRNFYNRMKAYRNGAINQYLRNAFNCYGIENFEIIIVEYVEDFSKLDEREQYWMDYYESYNPEKGYNICSVASSTYGIKQSEEQRKMHSDFMKEKWKEEDYRNFWHNKMAGENNYFYGKHLYGELNGMYGKTHSEETRKKISEANKGKKSKRSMKIRCVETGEIFESMTQAAKKYNTYASAIKLAVDNPKRTCRKLHFEKMQ